MSNVLNVRNLCKEYPKFQLDHVSFSVEEGSIMGFIGRNGAGKTTTLKALMNFIHPSSGEIEFFNLPMMENEEKIKQEIGYASGGVHFYEKKRIKELVDVTKRFYDRWDEDKYRYYLELFGLDEEKKLIELSEGMKVKFHLTLALSHHAKFLILDEPTSGLDPVSREELLEIFLNLADEGVTILFSTHITSDLDKCADHITYIHHGKIVTSTSIEEFRNAYSFIEEIDETDKSLAPYYLATCRRRQGHSALIKAEDAKHFSQEQVKQPDLETIMVHLEKEVD